MATIASHPSIYPSATDEFLLLLHLLFPFFRSEGIDREADVISARRQLFHSVDPLQDT